MKGYWQWPEATKDAFVEGSWFRSGDAATVTPAASRCTGWGLGGVLVCGAALFGGPERIPEAFDFAQPGGA
ncbi:hypothetical protein ACIQVC_18485 [Streptomyces sp. NPDC101112]|uniref:hypothetical protein n=1 Tax=Streptomyces sp. NPDC101112 TaxID=3366105 RepID=UPI0038116D81